MLVVRKINLSISVLTYSHIAAMSGLRHYQSESGGQPCPKNRLEDKVSPFSASF